VQEVVAQHQLILLAGLSLALDCARQSRVGLQAAMPEIRASSCGYRQSSAADQAADHPTLARVGAVVMALPAVVVVEGGAAQQVALAVVVVMALRSSRRFIKRAYDPVSRNCAGLRYRGAGAGRPCRSRERPHRDE
jgi:hypothetical protein